MCDVGPALDAQQVTAGPEPDFWQVAIDSDTVFDIEYDSTLERVVLSSRVARMRSEQRLEICELLLQVNFGWRETGGVRMALDGRSDDVIMMFEMPMATLRLTQLCTALGNLAGTHRVWRQMILDAPRAAKNGHSQAAPPWGQELA